MKYSVNKEEKYTILKLQEEKLDSTKAPDLKSEFVTLNAEGTRNLIMDMSDVKYSDSSGLSALLVGNRVFTDDGGIFILVALNDHVEKLVKISQLDNVLTILPTVEEGVDRAFMHELESQFKEGEEGDEA
ncbi:MAG TPA: anti-anti-sigma factor [Cytophagales bacterium]|nr:anti-anti-sigma factor [Cytophagales bacterium]HAA24321.1 anti-anti-sigma factor [Cytophagales bacterium]HAP63978.1 anti-anti-sigma factor [Cytophagales bacterium]